MVRADADQLLSEPEPSLDAWCYAMSWAALAPRLEDEESRPVYKDIELPVAGVLSRMEVHGIAVAKDVLQSQFDELSAEVDEIARQAYDIIGHEVNLASPKQLQTVLFEELGMEGTRSVKTGYSTNGVSYAPIAIDIREGSPATLNIILTELPQNIPFQAL